MSLTRSLLRALLSVLPVASHAQQREAAFPTGLFLEHREDLPSSQLVGVASISSEDLILWGATTGNVWVRSALTSTRLRIPVDGMPVTAFASASQGVLLAVNALDSTFATELFRVEGDSALFWKRLSVRLRTAASSRGKLCGVSQLSSFVCMSDARSYEDAVEESWPSERVVPTRSKAVSTDRCTGLLSTEQIRVAVVRCGDQSRWLLLDLGTKQLTPSFGSNSGARWRLVSMATPQSYILISLADLASDSRQHILVDQLGTVVSHNTSEVPMSFVGSSSNPEWVWAVRASDRLELLKFRLGVQ
jgi:hypothetical protein